MTSQKITKENVSQFKIGLALGSGSARGWAHIGVIRALQEEGIHVDYVAGTSIGAIVGAIFSSGEINTVEKWIEHLSWRQILSFVDVVVPRSGLIDGKKVADLIRKYVRVQNIEELPIPFAAVATDLLSGEEVVLKQGDIIEAIRASISLPGIFTPVETNGKILVDGGLVNPLPVSVVREMGANFVIAVDLNSDIMPEKREKRRTRKKIPELSRIKDKLAETPLYSLLVALETRVENSKILTLEHVKRWLATKPTPDIFEIIAISARIMQAQITKLNLKASPADLLIQPRVGHINLLGFNRAREAIDEGYKAAKYVLQNIMK
jgi:NTE family protein